MDALKIRLREPFISVSRMGNPTTLQDLAELDVLHHESSLEKILGISISNPDMQGTSAGSLETLRAIFPSLLAYPIFSGNGWILGQPIFPPRAEYNTETIRKAISRHEQTAAPCAMQVSSMSELYAHAIVAYQVAFAHYFFARRLSKEFADAPMYKDWQEFPTGCCGKSSTNVMLSLLHHGYPNVIYAWNSQHDHAFVLLPFAMEDVSGVILVDPSSDQLGSNKRRNAVFVKAGNDWSYRAGQDGTDLYPNQFKDIRTMERALNSAAHLRLVRLDDRHAMPFEDAGYLERAYSNRIVPPNILV